MTLNAACAAKMQEGDVVCFSEGKKLPDDVCRELFDNRDKVIRCEGPKLIKAEGKCYRLPW